MEKLGRRAFKQDDRKSTPSTPKHLDDLPRFFDLELVREPKLIVPSSTYCLHVEILSAQPSDEAFFLRNTAPKDNFPPTEKLTSYLKHCRELVRQSRQSATQEMKSFEILKVTKEQKKCNRGETCTKLH